MEAAAKGWSGLGVVETIYEEEHESSSSTVPSLSSSLSSPSILLHSRLEAWSMDTGHETDVLIYVQDLCFRLHKDPLVSRSGYLRRQLKQQSEITLSPPLNITAETFADVADFCYYNHIVITPFNVAALRTAAELLEMTETSGGADENLGQKTEAYFRQAVAVNREYALLVFSSCLPLLPEAESRAFLLSRCIQALSLLDTIDGVVSSIDAVKTVRPEYFELIVESLHRSFGGSHDALYKTVDFYLKEHTGRITEEQKNRICNHIDCNNLSPQLLVHAVQNPLMPLRFIVGAMFVEHLNTRRYIFFAANNHCHLTGNDEHQTNNTVTLGAILQRDAALRQAAKLKAAMDATNSRIQGLENELSDMRKLLNGSGGPRNSLESDSARSASFRLCSGNKVEREQRGSSSFHFSTQNEEERRTSSSSEESGGGTARVEKNFGRRLINRLSFTSKISISAKKSDSESRDLSKVDGGDVIVIKKKSTPFNERSRPVI